MAFWTRLGMNGPTAAMTALLVILVAVLLGGAAMFMREFSEQPEVVAEKLAEEVLEASDAEPVAENAPEAEPETVVVDAILTPEEGEPDAEPTPEKAPEPAQAPVLDVVRIDPKGSALLAGAGQLGSLVIVVIDDEEVFETPVDASGKFVALFDLKPSETPRLLTVVTQTEEGDRAASPATVLIAAVQTKVVASSTVETALAPDITATAQSETTAAPTQQEAPAPAIAPERSALPEVAQVEPNVDVATDVPEPSEPVETEVATSPTVSDDPDLGPEPIEESPAIVIADEDGVRVLQPAPQPLVPGLPDDAPEPASNVVIDTISYDAVGDVALSGRGNPNSFIRIYINDEAVQTTETGEDGGWAAPLTGIEAGVYRLRIDELNESGRVTSRIETPFQREDVSLAANASGSITVQPGFTLWAIARENFGSGDQFVRVYEANRDLIRDPDLIYPGQVFEIPKSE